MDYQRQSNGWLTFFEHYWFLVLVVSGLVAWQVLSFFTTLAGTPWIWCYTVALFVAGDVMDVGLIA